MDVQMIISSCSPISLNNMNLMNRLLLAIVFLFTEMVILSAQSDSVVYMGIGSKYVFFSDSTFKLICIPCDICPNYADKNNLISFGRYACYGDTAFILTSDPILKTSHMNMQVEECKTTRKGLIVDVDIPATQDSSDMLAPHYFFGLEIVFLKYPHSENLDRNDSIKAIGLYTREYYQNNPHFEIIPDTFSLPASITVKIYPKEQSRVSFAQGDYYIINKNNNTFIIQIPQFVTGFLNYERMNNKIIEIYKNGIIGDGVRTFVRKDIYDLNNYSPWKWPPSPDWRYRIP